MNAIRTHWASALMLAGLFVPSLSWASCTALKPLAGVLEISQGQQNEVSLPVPIKRIAIGDPEVADVYVSAKDSVLLTGLKQGTTSLMLWTHCAKEPQRALVHVQSSASQSIQPVSTASADHISQVQTDIRFVDISRSKLKDIGVSMLFKGNKGMFGYNASSGSVGPGAIGELMPTIPLVGGGFNFLWGGNSSRALGAINALENSGFAYTLAKPSLVAMSGQSASFLAGGEFPVPVPSNGSDSISIEYKEFGIRLTLTPTVVGPGRINLKVAPEVSELDFTDGIEIAGTRVPALKVRRTDTSVTLANGESFVISGLLSTNNGANVEKLPGLGDVPVLGAFFRSTQHIREDRELLMIVTPRLVQPLAADAQLPTLPGEKERQYDPNFYRMFFLENGQFDQRAGLSE